MNHSSCVWRSFLTVALFLIVNVHATASTSTTPPTNVIVHGDRVTANFDNAALEHVLATLGKPLGFTAHIDPALADDLITKSFKNMPIDLALDRLLTGMNYVLAGSSLYVWPREASTASQNLDTEEWTVVEPEESTDEEFVSVESLKSEVLQAPDPADRLAALEDLITYAWEEGEETMVPTLVSALQDEAPDVRTLALEGLYGIEEPEDANTIQNAVKQMAQGDPLPEHRALALVWLTERNPEEAKAMLEHTLADNDPDMRAFAAELLGDLQVFALGDSEDMK